MSGRKNQIQDVSQVFQESQNSNEIMKDESCSDTPTIDKKKRSDFLVRLISTIVMTGVFILMGCMGKQIIIPFLICIQELVYYEVIKTYNNFSDRMVSVGLSIIYQGGLIIIHSAFSLLGLYSFRVNFMPLLAGILVLNIGLFIFVKGIDTTKFVTQLGQLGITAFMILFSGFSFGLYCPLTNKSPTLFFISLSNVFLNDIMAYLSGRTFGRNKMSKLSPKKTWEGYFGALILTIILSPILSGLISEIPVLKKKQGAAALSFYMDVRYNPYLPEISRKILIIIGKMYPFLKINGFTIYSLFMSIFASTFGPLQGLIASAFKRMLDAKDFGYTIPGHGGFMDRFDCQMLTGSIAFVLFFVVKNILSGKF